MRQALEMALEALKRATNYDPVIARAITAIKEALAQPEQEPVASIFISGIGEREFDDWGHDLPVGRNLLYTTPPQPEQEPVGQLLEDAFGRGQVMWFNKPKDESMLYTTPPQRKPLTDEQREEIAKGWQGRNWTVGDIIDAIEAAHGIKE